MVCSKCGAKLKEGCVYCSQCGQEAQIVSEINILEDDLLREIMDDREGQGSGHRGGPEKEEEGQPEKYDRKNEGQEGKKTRALRRRLLILVAVLAAAVAVALGLFAYRQNHSQEHLLSRAQEAYGQKDYEDALNYADRILALNGENVEAMLLKGQVWLDRKEYEDAEAQFLEVLSLDPSCAEAYRGLLVLYDARGQKAEIRELMDGVEDEEILTLFEDYVVPEPEIQVESGSFSEYFTVEISAPEKGLEIYYTLDGTTPDEDSTLYEEPVEISDQGTTVLTAVCRDKDGEYSEPVRAEYTVELDVPDAPTASPDGGQFSMPAAVTVTVPEGTTVYYTWDGSEPDRNSARYSGAIQIPEGNNILSLVAIDGNGMKSSVRKYNYIYYPESTDTGSGQTDPVSG